MMLTASKQQILQISRLLQVRLHKVLWSVYPYLRLLVVKHQCTKKNNTAGLNFSRKQLSKAGSAATVANTQLLHLHSLCACTCASPSSASSSLQSAASLGGSCCHARDGHSTTTFVLRITHMSVHAAQGIKLKAISCCKATRDTH